MPEGFTIFEPGAPAGQEAAVIGSAMTNAGWAPAVTYVGDPFGYGSGAQYTTLAAAPAAGVAAGGITGGSSGNEALFQQNAGQLSNIVPAATTALSTLGISLPGWLSGALGVGGALYGVAQLLGLGQGGGLFGNNLLGGDVSSIGGVELGGPGLAEPSAKYVIKEWHRMTAAGEVQYYKVQLPNWRKPKTLGYYKAFNRWVVFKAPHLAVIGKNQPSHKQLTRLRRNLSRHSADARTILRITSPKSLRQPRRGRR